MQTEDRESAVKRSQEQLKKLEGELKKLEAEEKKELSKMKDYTAQLEKLRKELDKKRQALEVKEQEAVDAKKQASSASRELTNGEKQLLQLEQVPYLYTVSIQQQSSAGDRVETWRAAHVATELSYTRCRHSVHKGLTGRCGRRRGAVVESGTCN